MTKLRWILAGALWLCCVVAGFGVLVRYKSTAGVTAIAPATWPMESSLRPGKGLSLLMFLHPHCACSRASLAEMARLLERIGAKVSVRIVFIRPEGTPEGWQRTSLRDAAQALPGVVVSDDPGGVEAERFGATTSGTSLLYDGSGKLLFHGGITPLRGHEGNSFGQERIVALVTRGSADRQDSPVFGCALEDELAERPLAQGPMHGAR